MSIKTLTLKNKNLPDKIEEIQEFIIIGEQAINAHKAYLNAIKEVGVAKKYYDAKLCDGQKLGELVLEAQIKLGNVLQNTVTPRGCATLGYHGRTKTLPEGISKKQSHYAQTIAQNYEIVRDVINEAKRKEEIPTKTAVLKKVNQIKKKSNQDKIQHFAMNTSVVSELETLINSGNKFGTIYADPPWPYNNQITRSATNNHYTTMSIDEIAELPIKMLTAEKAHLHLWTTNAFLFDSKKVLESWGFEYKSCFVWVKPQLGIGNYWRVSHEFLLLGVKGGLCFLDKSQKSWINYDRKKHSEKPECIREIIEKVSPKPYLELFGRKKTNGWVTWGNEI